MSGGFQDHFSTRAPGYAAFRPTYPDTLFAWLAEQAPGRDVAWDCGTGSGQAVPGLASQFARVVATDASAAQVAEARPIPNVEFRVAPAEASGLPDRSADLITVAQALHWFDLDRFYSEVRRVGRPGALLACWMYNLMRIDESIDRVVDRFYTDVVGPWWPGNRKLIDSNYRDIAFPFPRVPVRDFAMTAEWDFGHLVGYLRTWSAVTRFVRDQGRDPIELVEGDLLSAWGDPERVRPVRWPLVVLAGRVG